jgi:hypothetical protein
LEKFLGGAAGWTGTDCDVNCPGVSQTQLTAELQLKAYVASTGALFGLVALAHLLRTFAEWSRLFEDPWFILEGPGLGVFAGALAVWAWRVLRQVRRTAAPH